MFLHHEIGPHRDAPELLKAILFMPLTPIPSHLLSLPFSSFFLVPSFQVVIVAPHSPFETNEQVRTVLTEEGDVGVFVKDAFSEQPQSGLLRVSVASPEMCSNILARPDVQELMKEEFDMIFLSLSFCDCFLSFVHQMKVKECLIEESLLE